MKFCMATKYYKSTSYILASIAVHGICIWDINSELGPGSESGIYLKSSIWQNLLSQSVFRCVYKHRERGREREPSRDFIHLLWFPCSNHMWEWIKKITHKKIFPKYHWLSWYDIWEVSPKVWGTTAWFCLLEGKKKSQEVSSGTASCATKSPMSLECFSL